MDKFDIKVKGIYQDICISSVEIATPDWTRDGLVRAQSWPVRNTGTSSHAVTEFLPCDLYKHISSPGVTPLLSKFTESNKILRIIYDYFNNTIHLWSQGSRGDSKFIRLSITVTS